jgi:DNA-binding transcriptional MocR family regulator
MTLAPTPDQPCRKQSIQRDLDPHLHRYAQRTAGMTASEIRALFAVASRPEVVSLAGGMPYLPALPLDSLADELAQMIATDGMTALQYGSAQGTAELRERICEVMGLEGIRAHADDVTVTVGSQMALDMVTRIFCDPGDVVLAEAPSYVGALTTFASYQAQVVQVPMDDDGLIPDELSAALCSLRAQGRTPKFLYTIPNFHNPAGVTLAVPRRAEILRLCAEHQVLIVEDNAYGLLGFDGQIYPALRSTDPDNVVYLGSFSKTFADCGSAGRWLHTQCGRNWCWPRSRRPCAPRRSPSSWWPATSLRMTGRARSRPTRRLTGSVETPCWKRWHTTFRRGAGGPIPRVAFTSGSQCPRGWTPRRCCLGQ